ncbi:MAG TPA: NADH-quinone oxidoreductase subunit M [Flavitalea sp.]|nr:NADH-quinone oxidoreductase subunit M [Flavitalea sp.]
MIPILLLLVPLLTGIICFFLPGEKAARSWSLLATVVTLLVSLSGFIFFRNYEHLHADVPWMPALGSRFTVAMDGVSRLLCLLTAIIFPVIFIATWHVSYSKAPQFYGLMLLAQAGLIGVFIAADALLFYFFWELALIPAYFLCSVWGGERRIAVTFKFFIYTFVGSLFMLVGWIYIYMHTADRSFALTSFYNVRLSFETQSWLFWLIFIAFAVKMPVFPFHTWQPDTYEQSPTAVTMVLSGVMVKMGVFGVLRWLAPVLPYGTWAWGDTVSLLSIIGMIYASLLAMRQDDLKRLVAYSSIAHIGLMSLAIFATNQTGMQGVMIQMFSHGINITGMWIVVDLIERQFGTRKISELGGLARKAPVLAILLVVIALANIALPLTNAFVGEFLMFTGVFTSGASKYSAAFAAVAGLSIILSAVYTLNMIQKVFYGNTNSLTSNGKEIRWNEKWVLSMLVVVILVTGVFPKPILGMTIDTVQNIVARMFVQN